MALQIQAFNDNSVAFGYDSVTAEKGLLLHIQIAEAVSKGMTLAVSPSVDKKYIKQTAEFDCVCIAAEAGSGDAYIWAWTTVCQVLYKENTASTRGYVALASATDGYAEDIDLATIGGSPATTAHFKEIGHVLESKSAGGAGTFQSVLIHFHTL